MSLSERIEELESVLRLTWRDLKHAARAPSRLASDIHRQLVQAWIDRNIAWRAEEIERQAQKRGEELIAAHIDQMVGERVNDWLEQLEDELGHRCSAPRAVVRELRLVPQSATYSIGLAAAQADDGKDRNA